MDYSSVSAHWLESLNTKKSRGMCHLYCQFAIPQKLIMTTDKSFIEIPVIGKKRSGIQHHVQNHPVTTDQLVESMTNLKINDKLVTKILDDCKIESILIEMILSLILTMKLMYYKID